MRVTFVIAASLISVISTTAAGNQGTITNATEFVREVGAVRADSTNYDKFRVPLKNALDGQHFKATVPFDTDMIAFGATSYDYENGKLLLSLSPDKAAPLLRQGGKGLKVVLIAESTRSLGSYVGQNAFGAKARVTSLKNDGAGIALVSAPRPMLRARVISGIEVEPKSGWFYEAELAPADAKALALKSAVEIEGTYAETPWGDAGFCNEYGSGATIQDPTDYYSSRCYVAVNVDRIAFVNEATGAVLKEWTLASAPALGSELWGGIRLGMSEFQVKTLWPAITDYGSLEANGANVSVRFGDDGVTSVEVHLPYEQANGAFGSLVRQYGQPVASKCIVETICYGRWNLSGGVSLFLTGSGELTYKATEAKPPVGFMID